MAIAEDTLELTNRRFRRMSSLGRGVPTPREWGDLPAGPGWPALAQTAALLRFRHRFHPYLQKKYGDIFTVRLAPGGRPLVFFTRPEHAKEIFAGDPEVFHAGKANAILGPIMGEHSLLLQDSMEHKRARKLLMPAFNGHALREYQSMISELAAEEVTRWQSGTEFRSLDRMNALTLEVILRVVYGVSDETRLAALRPRINATVDISPAILLGWAYPKLQRYRPWRQTIENQQELDRLMYAEIRERREATDLDERTDVLSRLLRVGDAEHPDDELSDTELARPADHPAAGRPRDHRDRAVLGALRGRPVAGAAAAYPGSGRR